MRLKDLKQQRPHDWQYILLKAIVNPPRKERKRVILCA
jgi:hypothetical protein